MSLFITRYILHKIHIFSSFFVCGLSLTLGKTVQEYIARILASKKAVQNQTSKIHRKTIQSKSYIYSQVMLCQVISSYDMVTLLHGAHVSPICFEVGLDTQLGHWSNFKIEYTHDKDKDKDKDNGA